MMASRDWWKWVLSACAEKILAEIIDGFRKLSVIEGKHEIKIQFYFPKWCGGFIGSKPLRILIIGSSMRDW